MDTACIIVPVADIYKDHTFTSEVVTQALMFEVVSILDTYKNWSKIEQWDGYKGWINNFYLNNDSRYLDNISRPNDFLYIKQRSLKIYRGSTVDALLPFGVALPVSYLGDNEFHIVDPEFDYGENGWSECSGEEEYIVRNPMNTIFTDGTIGYGEEGDYINDEYDGDIEEYLRNSIFINCLEVLGTSYKWGGKSSFGFDCSGLVQTVFKVNNLLIPRDSKDQHELVKNNKIDSLGYGLKCGDLIFFQENKKICHVGICLGDFKFIHCSGMVRYNSLDKEDELFDRKLMDKFVGVFSISEIIKDQLDEPK